MKKIYRDKIINIPGTDMCDQKFLVEYLINPRAKNDVEIIYMKDLLEAYKNEEILK